MPPGAEAAHRQAYRLARLPARRLKAKLPLPFGYQDDGVPVSLNSSAIGGPGGATWSITVEGVLARSPACR